MKRVAAIFAVLASTLAIAQQPPRSAQGGPMRAPVRGSFFLLMSPDVQKELGLSEAQKKSVSKLFEQPFGTPPRQSGKASEKGQAKGEVRPQFDRSAMEKRFQETEKKVDAILKPNQKLRLDEISLQMQGPTALMRDDIAKKVGLTEVQKKSVRSVVEKNRPDFRSMGGPGNQDWKKAMEEAEKKRKAMDASILKLLDNGQLAKWKKLLGKPFTMPAGRVMGGGRPAGKGGG